MHENNVQGDSHLGATHELISEAVELFICTDQLDLFNSAGIESLLRNLQYVEWEIKKKREAKAPVDSAQYFRARPRATGGGDH